MTRGIPQQGDILFTTEAPLGNVAQLNTTEKVAFAQRLITLVPNREKIVDSFLKLVLLSDKIQQVIFAEQSGSTVYGIKASKLKEIQIPLPPLDVQKEIVEEIEGYQKIIDGARQVVENYKPHIEIDPKWEMVELENLCEIVRGSSPRPQGDPKYYGGIVPRLMVADITRDGMYTVPQIDSLTELGASKSRPMLKGDVILTVSGNPGLPTILAVDACIHDGFAGFRKLKTNIILPEFLYFFLLLMKEKYGGLSVGAVFKNLNTNQLRKFLIPTPSTHIQNQIVRHLEREQKLVMSNKEIISLFEEKIKNKIAGIWGE